MSNDCAEIKLGKVLLSKSTTKVAAADSPIGFKIQNQQNTIYKTKRELSHT